MNFVIRSTLIVAALAGGGACTALVEAPATPLQKAAYAGDVAEVRRLVAGGADVNARGAIGDTALYWAARGGHPFGPHRCGYETEGRPAVVAALLELGADPNIRDTRPTGFGRSSGWTPLFVALHHGQFKTAKVLLEHGADPNIRSDQGRTALEVAAGEGAPRELIELMLAKGFDPARTTRAGPYRPIVARPDRGRARPGRPR